MINDLLTVQPIHFLWLQTFFNELFGFFRNINRIMELQRTISYFLNQFILGSSQIRQFSKAHFIEHKTN
jgi:hypothetical protein